MRRAAAARQRVEAAAARADRLECPGGLHLGIRVDLRVVGEQPQRDRAGGPGRGRQRAALAGAATGGQRKGDEEDRGQGSDRLMVCGGPIGHTPPMKTARRAALLEGAAVIGLLLGVMWVVEIVNKIDGQRLSLDGIYPRSLSGLPGVISAPFLHAGFEHLLGNTVPFAILGVLIALGGARRVIEVTVIVGLVAGLGTWLTASSGSDTVGASGIVFGYAGYLVARGFFTRRILELGLGVLVAVLFGGALAWDLIPHPGVSWQDHLFGGIGGILAARLLTRNSARGAHAAA